MELLLLKYTDILADWGNPWFRDTWKHMTNNIELMVMEMWISKIMVLLSLAMLLIMLLTRLAMKPCGYILKMIIYSLIPIS